MLRAVGWYAQVTSSSPSRATASAVSKVIQWRSWRDHHGRRTHSGRRCPPAEQASRIRKPSALLPAGDAQTPPAAADVQDATDRPGVDLRELADGAGQL